MGPETKSNEDRVLLLTPTGKDSLLIARVLERAGHVVDQCTSAQHLARELSGGAAAVIVAEEGLPGDSITFLTEALYAQPVWSDLPVIVLTMAGKTTRRSARLADTFKGIGNLTFLGRPVRMLTLLSSVQTACLARRRQYEVRALLDRASEEVTKRDQFIAMLGHELRNPLAAVQSSIDILTHFGCDDSKQLAEQCQIIARQSKHIARLVDDLLDVARLTSGRVALSKIPLNLNEAIERSVQAIRLAGRGNTHQIVVSHPNEEVTVDGDPVRLEQVFVNLLSNAVRYSPSSGKIEVAVEVNGSEAMVRFKDEGEGIQQDLLPKIFEPFVQAQQPLARVRGGLGLGLAIVHSLVRLHGGSVIAQSDGLDRGSEFIVRLPLSERKITVVHSEAVVHPGQLGRRSILVIEDNADARHALVQILRLLNQQVFEAEDGASGLEKLLSLRPDVALVDVGLPIVSGYEVARMAREQLGPSPFIVAVTGYGQVDDKQQALAAGFDAHLVKPLTMDRILQMLVTVISKLEHAN